MIERKIMINKNYEIPLVYQKMNERGYTNAQSDLYLWLNEMEWMPIEKIVEYEDVCVGDTFAARVRGNRFIQYDNNTNCLCCIHRRATTDCYKIISLCCLKRCNTCLYILYILFPGNLQERYHFLFHHR